jgi:20S proteasome subunit beta 2
MHCILHHDLPGSYISNQHHSSSYQVLMLGLNRLSKGIDGFELATAPHSKFVQHNQSPLEDHELEGGFDFGLHQRNSFLKAEMGMKTPKTTKTGTTIVGIIYANGVILGADTRATEGQIVADKNCDKIHYLSPMMYCAGAGTAADTEHTTSLTRSKLALHALNQGRQPRVSTAMTMLKQYLFKYQGHIGAALIIGGMDFSGPFVTMGSGSLAAMSVLESGWHPSLTREQGIELVCAAVKAGIFNDLGSGSNVDIMVMEQGQREAIHLRGFECPNPRSEKQRSYRFPKGTTPLLGNNNNKEWIEVREPKERSESSSTMDVSDDQ